jgi:hypothetical protein
MTIYLDCINDFKIMNVHISDLFENKTFLKISHDFEIRVNFMWNGSHKILIENIISYLDLREIKYKKKTDGVTTKLYIYI